MFKFQLPLRDYSPRVKLPDDIIDKAQKMAPGLSRLGCYLDKISWDSLTEIQQQDLIKVHFLGLKGECAFWSFYANDPNIALEHNEVALEHTQPRQDANLFGAEIEIKTMGKKTGLEYVGLRVSGEQWDNRKYDAYVLVYQQNTPVEHCKQVLSEFCILGFATKQEVENAELKYDKGGRPCRWIHYHYLHPAKDLELWNIEGLATLKMVTYKQRRTG